MCVCWARKQDSLSPLPALGELSGRSCRGVRVQAGAVLAAELHSAGSSSPLSPRSLVYGTGLTGGYLASPSRSLCLVPGWRAHHDRQIPLPSTRPVAFLGGPDTCQVLSRQGKARSSKEMARQMGLTAPCPFCQRPHRALALAPPFPVVLSGREGFHSWQLPESCGWGPWHRLCPRGASAGYTTGQ